MREAATIMKMIENVSSDDTEKLDEIDARVWCYMKGYILNPVPQFQGSDDRPGRIKVYFTDGNKCGVSQSVPHMIYTRSRDALKAIRPTGWELVILTEINRCDIFIPNGDGTADMDKIISGKKCETEELAELHAVIQAIEYERKQK